jgi:predicted RND superfamily exporter protein
MEEESEAVSPRKNTASTSSEFVCDSGSLEEADASPGDEVNEMMSKRQLELSFLQRRAVHLAERPYLYFGAALLMSLILSVIGMVVGEFTVSVDQTGWLSRGTMISERHAQYILSYHNREKLHQDETGEVWDNLLNNVQPGWESSVRRRLSAKVDGHLDTHVETSDFYRKLQSAKSSSVLAKCDLSWYGKRMLGGRHLWPVWKVKDVAEPNDVLLNHDTFLDLCHSEEKTQKFLENNGLCFGCGDNGCLPPYSIIFYARLTVPNGLYSDCITLAADWVTHNNENPEFKNELYECVDDLKTNYDFTRDGANLPNTCSDSFAPTLVDSKVDASTPLTYTSSIFATKIDDDSIQLLFENVQNFDKGTDRIEAAFDTKREHFVQLEINRVLFTDMVLATGSAVITTLGIFVHTRSPLLSVVGLLQISLSFPLAYFVYTFICGLTFFPFLNFIGVFILFALGADDIFVAVDKWKNARIELGPDAETTEVAARALPDAALSMLLTSLTTAVAFFGTAVCPVAPILCFAVFCGLLISMTYLMCVLMVFPALCIYDKATILTRKLKDSEEEIEVHDANSTHGESFVRRQMARYYEVIHNYRFGLLVVILGVFMVCAAFASRMEIPTSSDVRMLRPKNQFEKSNQWRKHLLNEELQKETGTSVFVMWGVKPADTGKLSDPSSFTQLVLDHSFQPSQTANQLYLLDFCQRVYQMDFADAIKNETCIMKQFDYWLQSQVDADQKDQVYMEYCNNATAVPVPHEDFDACMTNWSQEYQKDWVLSLDGQVTIMFLRFRGRVRYDSPFSELKSEWYLIEKWFENERSHVAPPGVNQMYFTSDDYWWYDTSASMISTAYVGAGIAIAIAASVIFLTSLSFMLTLFSTIAISYVLLSVTAGLVALGWTMGL